MSQTQVPAARAYFGTDGIRGQANAHPMTERSPCAWGLRLASCSYATLAVATWW